MNPFERARRSRTDLAWARLFMTFAIRVVAIGRRMPRWVAEACGDYKQRLPRQCKPELIEISSPRGPRGHELAVAEGRLLLDKCADDALRVVLDGRGKPWTTPDLAKHFADWMHDARPVALLIGGAQGHSPEVIDQADHCWSLGPLTLPHMLVRPIVFEQLYRAWTILTGHPYHRE